MTPDEGLARVYSIKTVSDASISHRWRSSSPHRPKRPQPCGCGRFWWRVTSLGSSVRGLRSKTCPVGCPRHSIAPPLSRRRTSSIHTPRQLSCCRRAHVTGCVNRGAKDRGRSWLLPCMKCCRCYRGCRFEYRRLHACRLTTAAGNRCCLAAMTDHSGCTTCKRVSRGGYVTPAASIRMCECVRVLMCACARLGTYCVALWLLAQARTRRFAKCESCQSSLQARSPWRC